MLALLWLCLAVIVFRASPGWGYDFEGYLLAGQRLAHGASIYLSWTVDAPFRPGPYGLYVYAPPLAVAMLPFTDLSLPAATTAWFVLRAVLLLGGIALMPVQRWVRVVVFVLAAVSAPVLTDLNLGNVSLIVLFLSVVAWRKLDRWPAAAAVALATALRPTFGVFLARWLIRRHWRPFLVCLVVGIALIGISLPFVGVSTYLDYVKLLRNLSDVTAVANNMALGATFSRFGVGDTLANLALLVGYAAAIGAMLFSLRRDREISFMVTLGATLLLAPVLWDHYLVTALVPAAFLLERGHRWGLALGVLVLPWIPGIGVPLLALAAMLAPLLAAPRTDAAYAVGDSKRITAPA